jgi:hypothetical protein
MNRIAISKAYLMIYMVMVLLHSRSSIALSQTESQSGAFLERPSGSVFNEQVWLLPNTATLIFVTETDEVVASYRDDGGAKIITALPKLDIKPPITAVFFSEGRGMSSRLPFSVSQNHQTVLMPPTIYGIPNINNEYGSLGFVGFSYPGSSVLLEITGSTNEKQIYTTLANTSGEWQLSPPKFLPGKYQAKVKANFSTLDSIWSQELEITILSPTDQLLQDMSATTRRQFEQAIEGLPDPLKRAALQLDEQSDFLTKYVLPSLLTLTTVASSGILLQNLLYLLFQAVNTIGQALGLVRKGTKVGLVYDAVTKLPLGRAIVRLYSAETHRLLETDVTSASGTFSFLVPEGRYYLRVSKPGYLFPTRLILAKRDGKFDAIYSGGDLAITQNQAVISVAVPMDPKEVVENSWQRFTRVWQRWFEPINRWLLLVGFFLAVLSYSRDPSRLNFVILWLYLAGFAYVFTRGIRIKREYGIVTLSGNHKPLPQVELNLLDVEYKRLVSRRVSDDRGRYSFMVPPGRYQIKVVTPGYALDQTALGAYRGDELVVAGEKNQAKRIIPKIVVKAA